MSNPTETSGSDEPDTDSATRHRRHLLARLWNSGIPLWQKLFVWAGALGVAWTTVRGFAIAWEFRNGIMPHESLPPSPDPNVYGWYATGLVLSAGLWIWPLARGRWRTLALLLSVPATLGFLALIPLVISPTVNLFSSGPALAGIGVLARVGAMPIIGWIALAMIWLRLILDFRAARRG